MIDKFAIDSHKAEYYPYHISVIEKFNSNYKSEKDIENYILLNLAILRELFNKSRSIFK